MENIFVQIIGIIAGICTSVSFVPQLIKIIKTKEAGDVSLFMLIIREVGLALWVVYGSIKGDFPVLITFAFSFLINTAVIVYKIKYWHK
jgi:MtN3 and saliva related transmembrane protein